MSQEYTTSITYTNNENICIRGYQIENLMNNYSFVDVIFLLHKGKLPSDGEKNLLNAILIAGSDHGFDAPSALTARIAASGNRAAFEAPIAAGILAIGDAHGGAGQACMELIRDSLIRMEQKGISAEKESENVVEDFMVAKKRIPGLGHRLHDEDKRATFLFDLAKKEGIAAQGVNFIEVLSQISSNKIKHLPINVDGALAAVLFDMGFLPIHAKAFFIIARTAGLTAHVVEEYTCEKPMRFKISVKYNGADKQDTGLY